jgi:hypothetical protein
MQGTKVLAAAAVLGVALFSSNAGASAPAGVWVKVEQVVYAPDATNPTHVQVHGAIMLFDGDYAATRPYPGYTSPALGYVYYQCPDGQAETCRQEWRDLEANIAKPDTECVGFGMTSLPTGTLRPPGKAADNPDVYPIQSGVSPGFTPCQAIARYLAEQTGAGGAGGATTSGGANQGTGGTSGTSSSAGGTREVPPGGSSGSDTKSPTASGQGGTMTDGRAGSGGRAVEPEEPAAAKATPDSDNEVAGCSIAAATGAASLFGLAAALGILGLSVARRNRRRK